VEKTVSLKVLGPLFFLLCINDLPAEIKDISKPILFADISLILVTPDSKQLKDSYSRVVGKIMRWFQANSLILNFSKSYCMYFTAIRRHIEHWPIYIFTFTEKCPNKQHPRYGFSRGDAGLDLILARTHK
jgi:hypothetical protein